MNRRTFVASAAAAAALSGLTLGGARARADAILIPKAEHRYARANYSPGAPIRDRVGAGKIIRGQVLSIEGGAPIAGARVEYWLNTTPLGGDAGERNPANRGAVITDAQGRFRFETDPPARVYSFAEPHIHTRAEAAGHDAFYYRHPTPQSPSEDEIAILLLAADPASAR